MYKLTRPDGTDFHSGTINYAENVGKIIRIKDYDPPESGSFARGLHACYKPLDAFSYNAEIPCRVFTVKGIGRIIKNSNKARYKALKVIKEVDDLDKLFGFNYTEAANPIHPFKLSPPAITPEIIFLLKSWDSVRDSAWYSVRTSVGYSVWYSVAASVRDSVWASVRYSVWDSVADLVWDSVGGSVGDPVWDSAWDSVWAYLGSMFPQITNWKCVTHNKGTYPFQPAVDLWKMGIVPSFDGKLWRLHAGEKADVVWKGKP